MPETISIVVLFIILAILVAEAIFLRSHSELNILKAHGIALLMNAVPGLLLVVCVPLMMLLDGSFIEPVFGLIMLVGIPVGTTVINSYILKRITYSGNTWRFAIGITLMYFVIILMVISTSNVLNTDRAQMMSRAKGSLRSIGSSQLAYQGANNQKFYGTFEALKKDMYIAEVYTLSNRIEGYSMSWQVNNISTAVSEEIPSGVMSSFTVIAWPRDKRKGFLNTFGVTEDQVVRVYNPDNKNRLGNVATWDPIL